MLRSLFPLAVQGTLRKRRSSALVFFVLLLSFSCALMALSLTASIAKTNENYRYDVYGEWYLAIPAGLDGDAAWLSAQPWATGVGTVTQYANTTNGNYAFGTMDESAVALMHMELLDGRLPEAEGEIALTKRVLLSILRLSAKDEAELHADDPDYTPPTAEEIDRWTLGQSIPVNLSYSYENSAGESESGSAPFHYTLVGVIEDYCDMWTLERNRTNAAFVELLATEETAQSTMASINTHVARNGGTGGLYTQAQYYAAVKTDETDTAYAETTAYMQQSRDLFSDHTPCRNTMAYPSDEDDSSNTRYTSSARYSFVDADGTRYEFETQAELDAFVQSWIQGAREEAQKEAEEQKAAEHSLLLRLKLKAEELCSSVKSALLRSSERLYTGLIALVALTAVLCVYMMQLQSEVHSFAVLRSIGVTKRQMLVLMLLESALLTAPAVLLGIPLGMLLTKLALRLLMYSESVQIVSVMPYAALGKLFVLWLAVIVASRLIIFAVTVRTPLTGRMQLSTKQTRRTRRARSALIALLLAVFGATVVYTVTGAVDYEKQKQRIETTPGFQIYEINGYKFQTLIPSEWIERLETFPGILHVEPYCDDMSVWLSYDGLDECQTGLWVIEAESWQDSFRFGDDLAAFEAGELVLLCMKGDEKGSVILPADSIRLRAIYNNECTIDVTTPVRVEWTDESPNDRGTLSGASDGMWGSYQVVCSPAFFEKFLQSMIPGGHWYYYTQGDAVGYEWLLITADMDLYEAMSTNKLLQNFCDQYSTYNRNVRVDSQQENYHEKRQLLVQQLILLYACGSCIAVVTLLLLASALALEAEQERRSYTILRVIGMSNRQMQRKVAGKALWRSAFAAAFGWAFYAMPALREAAESGTLREAVDGAWRAYQSAGGSAALIWQLSLGMLAVLWAVSMFSKRGLKQSTMLK